MVELIRLGLAYVRCGPQSVDDPADVELLDLSVEVGPLDTQGVRGVSHAPPVLLEHRGDVVTLESLASLP